MSIESIAQAHGFTLESSEGIPEIEGTAHVMRHTASKARLLYLQNDDANKAFSISFKTPAADDTGVFHILEHSVLCGSEKFPVKEPFVNLLKSSMQTFLNAMTFPDKTMYPVASTNEQDLLNLMDVYLDAVFHPAIYQKRTIFEQEGWHYELTAKNAHDAQESEGCGETAGANAQQGETRNEKTLGNRALTYNGVVFNEMKGALSDPESVLYDALSAALFPNTTYRFESGGTPKSIPDLTYEAFLDNHTRHYRPDNSYITLYGNLDLDTFLGFLDERYLAPLAQVKRTPLNTNPLEVQQPVRAMNVKHLMATAPENAACALGFVVGHARERERIIATDILLDALMGSNEAPLKRALLDAGLAADASAFIADAVLQPFAVIQLRGLREGKACELARIVERNMRELAEGGLDHDIVEAALSHAEFVMRERNFGYADGVVLAMSSMSGWLYDDALATAYLRYDDIFANLRAQLEEGYFETLIRELFLENDHYAEVELVPTPNTEDDGISARLAAVAKNMAPADFDAIDAEVEKLRAAQEKPDAPEDLAKLPQLRVSDIGEAPAEPPYHLDTSQPMPTLRHDAHTHGIAYAYRYFDLNRLTFEELPYATVLAMVLGKLDTENRSAAELDTLAQSKLGNLSFFTEVHENASDAQAFSPKFVASASALEGNVEHLAKIPNEVLIETRFSDQEKILDILTQKKVGMEQGCANAGHSAAMARVASYYLPAAVVREQLGGMDFYRFLTDLINHFDKRKDELSNKLRNISRRLFSDNGCLLSFAGSDAAFEAFQEKGGRLCIEKDATPNLIAPKPTPKNEAFIVPTDVTFTAVGYDRRLLNSAYTGAWLVASRALSYDYLWNEVRVKGGAYGAGFQTTRSGNMRFYSYRDPHVDQTIERFENAGAWLSSFNPDAAEMDGYVVSTTASFDAPQKPRELIRRQDGQFLAGYTSEERMRIRSEVIETTPAQVRALGDAVSAAAGKQLICTFGNREAIEQSKRKFTLVDLLND